MVFAVNTAAAPAPVDVVTVSTGSAIASFVPREAFGLAVDGGSQGESAPLFLAANRRAMRDLASYRTSYRLRTELGIEAWHWSSAGRWSDAAHAQGYWTGDPSAADASPTSYGYRLPRRGDTRDEANDDGFSRIDDGDPGTFWKSNPYLDARYTGVAGDHADWIVIELARAAPIDTIEIRWAAPYAVRFQTQYWVGEDEYTGRWMSFPGGGVTHGTGGLTRLALVRRPIGTKFVRILLQQSSHTAPIGASDARDRLGYAVSEVRLGWRAAGGTFHDVLRHDRSKRQTLIHVSSTDPWHRAIDRDPDTEQPSLVQMQRLGLIGPSPIMAPIGVLYDTPENMIAFLAYLRRFGVSVGRVELGEEPDGQFVTAADYGALYVEFARRLRAAFPGVALGGPSLVNGVSDTWLDDSADQSWTSQFIFYLRRRRASDLLDFFSFEYFPFDDVCGSSSTKLSDETAQMRDLYARLRADGVPRGVPWVISEYGFSAFAGEPLVQMPSALFTADMLGDFLSRGGRAAFLYGATPDRPIDGETACAGKGNLMLWERDARGLATWAMPSLTAYRMVTRLWAQPGAPREEMYRATASGRDGHGRAITTAYPIRHPDGRWSIMLVNRGTTPQRVAVRFAGARPRARGVLLATQYSAREYRWDHVAATGHPSLDDPPIRFALKDWATPLLLPAMSLSVVSER